MKKKPVKVVCVCGHPKLTHTPKYFKGREGNLQDYMPNACYRWVNEVEFYMCRCQCFKLDNLKYLEDIYKTKNGKSKNL